MTDAAPDPFDQLRGVLGPDETVRGRRRAFPLMAAVVVTGVVVAFSWLRPDAGPPAPPRQALGAAVPDDTTPAAVERVWPHEPVEIVGTEVRTGGHRWNVGEPGDLVAVGDWDCDGAPTPGVLRPSMAQLHLFQSWAESGEVETASPGPTVPPGAVALEAGACGHASVRTSDGSVVDIATGGES